MKLEPTSRLRQQLILLGVVLILLVGGLLAWKLVPFRQTGTTPSLSKVTTLDYTLDITFNHTLNSGKTSVKKADFISSYKVDSKKISVNLTGLNSNQKYTVTVPEATDSGGRKLRNLTFTFTAVPGDAEKLSKKEETKLLDEQQKRIPATTADSVLKYIPYSTLNYRIEPVSVDDKITLHIQLLLAPDLAPEEKDATVAKYKEQARVYLSGRGIDINDYTVNYEVVQETLTGR